MGEVHKSAKVILNGVELETLVDPGYSLVIKASEIKEQKILDIIVSNLMANCIIDLDKRKV